MIQIFQENYRQYGSLFPLIIQHEFPLFSTDTRTFCPYHNWTDMTDSALSHMTFIICTKHQLKTD